MEWTRLDNRSVRQEKELCPVVASSVNETLSTKERLVEVEEDPEAEGQSKQGEDDGEPHTRIEDLGESNGIFQSATLYSITQLYYTSKTLLLGIRHAAKNCCSDTPCFLFKKQITRALKKKFSTKN